MTDSSSLADPVGKLAEEFIERYRRGERPAPDRVHRAVPGAGRPHPRRLPDAGGDGGGGLGASSPGTPPDPVRGGHGSGRRAAGADRRLPHPPRGRPGRHGRGLRGRAGLPGPARRPEGPARPRRPRPRGLERFRREARAAARLHHTNIVPVFEVGQDGGVIYYAMQFIQGQPLDAVLDELKALRPRPDAPRGADAARNRSATRPMSPSRC